MHGVRLLTESQFNSRTELASGCASAFIQKVNFGLISLIIFDADTRHAGVAVIDYGQIAVEYAANGQDNTGRTTRAMKNTDIKFVTGQILLIVGLFLLSIGGQWSFFTGLILVMISALFSLRATRPNGFAGWIIRLLLWIGCMAFLAWFSSFGTEKPPIAALVGVWLGCSIDEVNTWRLSRRLT